MLANMLIECFSLKNRKIKMNFWHSQENFCKAIRNCPKAIIWQSLGRDCQEKERWRPNYVRSMDGNWWILRKL